MKPAITYYSVRQGKLERCSRPHMHMTNACAPKEGLQLGLGLSMAAACACDYALSCFNKTGHQRFRIINIAGPLLFLFFFFQCKKCQIIDRYSIFSLITNSNIFLFFKYVNE